MWEGGGTVPPELGVARRLIARGHQVHILGDPTIGAVQALLGDETYKTRARALAERIWNESKGDRAVEELEALARGGTAQAAAHC